MFLDTPTREKGQFTGDTVDISFANMIAAGDRNASARAIREIVYSRDALVEGGVERLLHGGAGAVLVRRASARPGA